MTERPQASLDGNQGRRETRSPILRAEGLTEIYQGLSSQKQVTAIRELDLEVEKGERVAIVRSTGCGKSTFFRIVCGLERPTAGRVEVEGRCPYEEFDWFRGRLGVVFQEDRLLPWRTALQNVTLGLEFLSPSPADTQDQARSWLERLGLGKSMHSYPGELSGGMRQRVAMARAFAPSPHILLADEAFGQLDPVTSRHLREDFLSLCIKQRTTVLLITHQLEEALEVGERVVVFGRPGHIVEEVRTSPNLSHEERELLRKRLERALIENSDLGE